MSRFGISFRELLETMEQNAQLKKQVSDLLTQNQQQVSPKCVCVCVCNNCNCSSVVKPGCLVTFQRLPLLLIWNKMLHRPTKV